MEHIPEIRFISAIETDDSQLFAELISSGEDINAADWRGNTPLMAAAAHGRYAMLKRLLRMGANVHAKNDDAEETALRLASSNGHLACVEILIAHAAPVDIEDRDELGRTVFLAAVYGGHDDVAKRLYAENPTIAYIHDYRGNSPLHVAASKGHLKLCGFMLEIGADINCKNSFSKTPLHAAAWDSQSSCIEYLMMHGADPNLKDSHGKTPIDVAHDSSKFNKIDVSPLIERLSCQKEADALQIAIISDIAENEIEAVFF